MPSTSLNVDGKSCPWKFRGTGVDNPGTANSTAGGFAAGFNDGSTAGGAGVGLNTSYRYGQQHTSPAGELPPSTIAVNPFDTVVITYGGTGKVTSQAGGTSANFPIGFPGVPSLGANETDSAGYNYPSNYISGCLTTIGGLVGAFTDSSGAIISTFDYALQAGRATLVLTSVSATSGGNTVYNGTITGGGNNFYAGWIFVITGFVSTGGINNGQWLCTASTTGTLTLVNGTGVAETHAGSAAGYSNGLTMQAPAGAAFISLGVNDTILRDNTGSFDLVVSTTSTATAIQVTPLGWKTQPTTYPIGQVSIGRYTDLTALRNITFMVMVWFAQFDYNAHGLLAGYFGQLFPRGAQNTGGSPAGSGGQNFPY